MRRTQLLRLLWSERRAHAVTRQALDVAHSTNRAVQHLIRCTDPAMHLRLAHELEQARARLGETEGADPHAASLRLVPLEADQ